VLQDDEEDARRRIDSCIAGAREKKKRERVGEMSNDSLFRDTCGCVIIAVLIGVRTTSGRLSHKSTETRAIREHGGLCCALPQDRGFCCRRLVSAVRSTNIVHRIDAQPRTCGGCFVWSGSDRERGHETPGAEV